MDIADSSQKEEEYFLKQAIHAARGQIQRSAKYCRQCGVELEAVRKTYGLCYECAERNEKVQNCF